MAEGKLASVLSRGDGVWWCHVFLLGCGKNKKKTKTKNKKTKEQRRNGKKKKKKKGFYVKIKFNKDSQPPVFQKPEGQKKEKSKENKKENNHPQPVLLPIHRVLAVEQKFKSFEREGRGSTSPLPAFEAGVWLGGESGKGERGFK